MMEEFEKRLDKIKIQPIKQIGITKDGEVMYAYPEKSLYVFILKEKALSEKLGREKMVKGIEKEYNKLVEYNEEHMSNGTLSLELFFQIIRQLKNNLEKEE